MRSIAIIAAIVTAFSFGFAAGENEGKSLLQAEYEKGYVDALEGQLEYMLEIYEDRVPEEPELVSIGTYTATAYCPCSKCCGKSDGITASGVKATAGRTIAADTSKLPFGTSVYIDGHKYTVEDRGGAIKGNRIDIYFDTHAEATQYGRQQVELYIEK